MGGDKSTFPDYKNGQYFSGISESNFSGAQLEESNIIHIKRLNKFIKYNQISAYRWSLRDVGKYFVELKLINPRSITKAEVVKELI